VKTPIAFTILLGIAATRIVQAIAAGDVEGWLPDAFVLGPALGIFAFFSLGRHDLGLRYLLPTYAFLYVFAGRAAESLAMRPAGRVALASLVAWLIGASWWIHPHYLAYFNEIVGGTEPGLSLSRRLESRLGPGPQGPQAIHGRTRQSSA
jgi:hypothetical protein